MAMPCLRPSLGYGYTVPVGRYRYRTLLLDIVTVHTSTCIVIRKYAGLTRFTYQERRNGQRAN
jgi:hypothetical protein